MDELIVTYSDEILVKVRHNSDVTVELTNQGTQGPEGKKGDTGTVTPEMIAARDAAVQANIDAQDAKTEAQSARSTATTAAGNATTAYNNANTAKTGAETARGQAETARNDAQTARTGAQTAEANANTAKTAAETARDKSQAWADGAENRVIEGGSHSAKHHAIKAAASASTASTHKDTAVDARTKAQTAQTNSETARDAAIAARTGAQTAQGLAEGARDTAQAHRADAQTFRGEAQGARNDALTHRNKAQQWAEGGDDVEVEAGQFSARHHARRARDAATTATAERGLAQGYRNEAINARNAALDHRDKAQAAQSAAETARTDTQTARTDAIGARAGAEAAMEDAVEARDAAAGSATTAKGHADRADAAAALAEATNPANYMVKAQNGADVPNKPAFVQNIGAVAQQITLNNDQDLKTVVASGFYKLGGNPVDGPGGAGVPGMGHSNMIVGRSGDTLSQMIFPYAGSAIWYRTGNQIGNATPVWQPWKKLFDSVNKPGTADVTGLDTALGNLAPRANPTFTGTVTVPTVATSSDSTVAASTAFVKAAIAAVIDAAPGALDTLNELAAAIGDDPNFATTMADLIGSKLASADFTGAAILSRLLAVDGAGSGLDADNLDGLSAAFLRNASNLDAGTVPDARLPERLSPSQIRSPRYSLTDGVQFDVMDASMGHITSFMMGEFSDVMQFRSVTSAQYFDGSNWIDWAAKIPDLNKLLAGRPETRVYIPVANRNFRFTMTLESHHAGALWQFYQEWVDGGPKAYAFKIERSAYPDFRSGSVTVVTEGTGNGYLYNKQGQSHSPENYYRFTFDFLNHTVPASLVWMRGFTTRVTYGAYGGLPFTWDEAKTIKATALQINNVPVATTTYTDTAIAAALQTNPYFVRPAQPAGTNLNVLTAIGTYYFDVAANITTALMFPSASRTGRLVVDKNYAGDHIYQEYTDDSANSVWKRYSVNSGSTWSSWQAVWTQNSLPTVSQADAEAGTSTSNRVWTAQRVRQAIVSAFSLLTKANVGLDRVDNTNDLEKPISTATQTALDGKQASGSYEPARTAATQAEAEAGSATTVRGWTAQRVRQAIDAVVSTLGIGNISGLQAALDGKQASGSYAPARSTVSQADAEAGTSTSIRDWTAQRVRQAVLAVTSTLTKSSVGLDQVDNTSDAAKPVSTDQQNAINGRLATSGGTLTGKTIIHTAHTTSNDTYSPQLEVRAPSATGDAVVALGFHIQSQATRKIQMRADGMFGLNGWTWYVDTAGNMTAAGNVSAYSDPALKDEVERIGGALDIIDQLDGVRFTWNDRSELVAGKHGKRDIGILADQVQAVLPEIVSYSIVDESGQSYRTVDYDKLVPVLIEAIKELRAEVAELRKAA